MNDTQGQIKGKWYKGRLCGLLAVLIVLLSVFIWLCIRNSESKEVSTLPAANQAASEWLEISGESRAYNVSPRKFELWELRDDDSVRYVELHYRFYGTGGTEWFGGVYMNPADQALSFDTINGQLINQTTTQTEYRGGTYYYNEYFIYALQNEWGMETLLLRPPHLHILDTDRLISIGVNPQSRYVQSIFAVAIQSTSNITSIFDYQPYRHIQVDDWDVFYYDVTSIQSHVSIHIRYVPGVNTSALDWAEVDTQR